VSLFRRKFRLPWKKLATRLFIQRNDLLSQSAKQRRLLLWILNQIVLEQDAGQALAYMSKEWDHLLSLKSNPRGQA